MFRANHFIFVSIHNHLAGGINHIACAVSAFLPETL